MKLLLIRHAESENNTKFGTNLEEYQSRRQEDPNITAKGKAQCQNLGLYLLKKKLKFKKIYCSAMVRAMETVTIIQNFVPTNVEIKVNTHEVGGIYNSQKTGTGKTRSWIKEHYPKIHIPSEVTEDGWFRLTEKENRAQGLERARVVLEDFKKMAAEGVVPDDEYIGMVTHGNFMDAILAIILDRREDSTVKIVHANTGLTLIEFNKNGTNRLVYMNMADHLEEDFSVLALELSKEGNYVIDSKLEDNTKEDGSVRLNRSVSTGDTVQNQIQRMKKGGSHKKELKTNEDEDDAPFRKNSGAMTILEKIDEVPEKIAK